MYRAGERGVYGMVGFLKRIRASGQEAFHLDSMTTVMRTGGPSRSAIHAGWLVDAKKTELACLTRGGILCL